MASFGSRPGMPSSLSRGSAGKPQRQLAPQRAPTVRPTCSTPSPAWQDLPWKLSWQVNERSTTWSAVDRAELASRVAQGLSGLDAGEWRRRMDEVASVLPDLKRAVHAIKPEYLADLVAKQGADALAAKLITLKAALPRTNVGMLLLVHPPLLALGSEELLAGLRHAQARLGEDVAEGVVQWYPALMRPEVLDSALAELQRLVPHLLKASGAKDWVHLLGISMRVDATLGGSDAWDPTTQSWRD